MTLRAIAVATALGASVAHAASEHAEHHAPSIGDLFWPLLNFALFAFLFYRFAWPMIIAAMAERRRQIVADLGKSETAAKEAREGLAAIEALRARESEDRQRMVNELRAEGEHERSLVVEAARRAAERMREDARRLGEQETARASLEIRRQVAAEATRRAAALLEQRLGEADQQRFVRDFLAGAQKELG